MRWLLACGVALLATLGPALLAPAQDSQPPANAAASSPTDPTAGAPATGSIADRPESSRPEASPTPAKSGRAASAAPEPATGEVEPSEYLLPDREGRLEHVLNFSFEDFIRIYQLQHRLGNPQGQPKYVIHEIQLAGTAAGRQAELTAEFSIDVRDAGWVRVPLRLGQAILLREAEFEGSGEQLLEFENPQEGYVSWIRAEAGKIQKVKLKLLVPLATISGETQLRLNLPRTPLGKLDLLVAGASLQGKVSEGSELTESAAAGGQTRMTVLGIGGDFELGWHAADDNVANVPPVLEATGQLLARIDGHSVTTDVRLAVRSFGGPFDRFRLRLPPGAALMPRNRFGVQLVPVETGKESTLIEVRLAAKTRGPLDLRLMTERPYNVGQQDELLELAGFEVQGAARQWGNIAVQVVGDWQVNWETQRNVRQIDELPDVLRRENPLIGFEYYVQPYSLTARVVPQKTRTSVEPEYLVSVGAHQMQLQARWKYNVRGAKLRALKLALPDWEIDEIGSNPPGLVNLDAAFETDGENCSIPLAKPESGPFEITLRAHQAVVGTETELAFELPRPYADTVSQAIVAVSPADNVELSPRTDAMTGLAPQSLRPPIKLPERQQDALFYRTEGANSAAKQPTPDARGGTQKTNPRFVAGIQLHEQSIATDVVGTVTVDDQSVGIEERLVFQVAYEPVDSLAVLVPRAIPLDELVVTLDGQPLALTASRPDPTTPGEEPLVRLALPGPRIGRLDLQLRCTLTHKQLAAAATTSVNVPLVMPAMGKLGHNTIRVLPQAGILVALRKGPWTPEANPAAVATGLQVTAPQAVSELALAIELKQRPAEGKTVVECGWIQTALLAGGLRQDRALYRFHSGERQLRLALPDGADATSVEVTLDGKSIETVKESAGEILVPLGTGDGSQHLLDLSYSFPRHSPAGPLQADPPQIRPAPRMRRLYWELVMPATDHLLLAPADFTAEYSWMRSGLLWYRVPSLDQPELEKLVGLTAASTSGAPGNRYLFSTVGQVQPLKLWWAPRSALVFGASALLLAVGLALIYFPRLRHPAAVFALGILVLAGTLVNPDAAIVVAQAGAVGVALLALAALLARRTLAPPTPVQQSSTRGSSRAVLDRSVTEAYFRSARAMQPSTATAPAVQASPESQS